MSAEQNKAIVRRFFEAFDAGDEESLRALLAPDLVAYNNAAPGRQDREAHLQGIRDWNEAFGDTRFAVHEQIAEDNTVVTRTSVRAVHSRAPFQGVPPSGKEVTATGISLERVVDGRIVERRVIADYLGLMQQIGLIPQMG